MPMKNDIKAFIEGEKAETEEVRFAAYTVVSGDSLYNICVANNLIRTTI